MLIVKKKNESNIPVYKKIKTSALSVIKYLLTVFLVYLIKTYKKNVNVCAIAYMDAS